MSSNTPTQHQRNKPVHSNDIDLFELFQSIWQEKILIVIVTAVFTVFALVYALTATPFYQTQASLVPPPAYAIQDYNEGRMETFGKTRFKEFDAYSVYKIYLSNLRSLQLRTAFFEDVYLPSISADDRKINRDKLLLRFNKVLKVKLSDPKNNPDLYHVSVEFDDPTIAAEWVKQYIDRAIAATKLELRSNIEAEQKVHINSLKLKIKSLVETAEIKREDQIKLLKEALSIAESIGLENSSPQSDKASLGGNRYIDNDLIYTRGAKTLRAQLRVLENRTSNEPFIAGFRELNTQLELLQNFQLDDSNVSVVQIDEIAEIPNTPIKPNKKLIVAVGILIGGVLGVFAALIRTMVRKRKEQQARS